MRVVELNRNAFFQMRFTEVKSMADGTVRIKGYASTPQLDRYDDIVDPKAFEATMMEYMRNPVVLFSHYPDKVLGRVIDYDLDATGLQITAELSNDVENTFHNITQGNIRGFSIGFLVKQCTYTESEKGKQIRTITNLDLVEISVVSTPANP